MLRSCRWLVPLLAAPFIIAQAPVAQAPPDQLDDLVAPIALYPDQLLGQILAASTYPLEIVQAQQWRQQNPMLQGPQLMDAARQQNWDASVQALVAFPAVLTLLSRDVRWTTDLGNAFLDQQADVMDAVQRLRRRARDSGRLPSTPQQTVTVAEQDGQAAIQIQPANPQVVYVPAYNPAYVWGPPAYGAYPALGYPSVGYGFNFNPAVLLGTIFSGLLSFGGWGWALNWLAHGLFLNNLFFGHFGFGGGYGHGGYGATSAWVHNPGHRLGVAYPNRALSARFGSGHSYAASNARTYSARSYNTSPARSSTGWQRASESSARTYQAASGRSAQSYRTAAPESHYNSAPRASSFRESTARSSNARASNYGSSSRQMKAPRMQASKMKAPKMSSSHMKAPKSGSGGHSGGGHSGKHR